MLGVKVQNENDRLDYDLDFSRWMTEGDLVTDATATADYGLIIEAVLVFGQIIKVWISGGEAGKSYDVTVTITTQYARVKDARFTIRITGC